MNPEHIRSLRETLEPSEGPGCSLSRFGALLALNELESPSSGEPQHKQFLSLCRYVVEGYQGMNDEQISSAQATPRLMRYLVSALEKYAAEVKRSDPEASGRRKALGDAFGVSGKHGGDRKSLWTDGRKMRVLVAYTSKLYAQTERNSSEAELLAREAAYDEAFGTDASIGREPGQRRKNLEQLDALLIEHGYLWLSSFDRDKKLNDSGKSNQVNLKRL